MNTNPTTIAQLIARHNGPDLAIVDNVYDDGSQASVAIIAREFSAQCTFTNSANGWKVLLFRTPTPRVYGYRSDREKQLRAAITAAIESCKAAAQSAVEAAAPTFFADNAALYA